VSGSCPRCAGAVATGQEYCLACGSRLPGSGRLGPPPRRSIRLPLLLTLVLAVAGAATAIALTRDEPEPPAVLTLTGGSVTATVAVPAPGLVRWPRGRDGWTIVLVSVPKQRGRDAAVARAQQARERGLRQVGVLDSGTIASLRPGYWMVFSGVYASEPEATSSLLDARVVSKTAAVRRIAA
jgi:hypothetical protein